MSRVAQKKLEESVALAGPYLEQRLRALKIGVDLFRRAPDLPALIRGPLAAARRALKGLRRWATAGRPGCCCAAGHPVLPVDARQPRGEPPRLRRGTNRFREKREGIRAAASVELPGSSDAYRRAFTYLNHHGAATCTDADPHCHICPLLQDCPAGRRRSP